MSAFFNNVKKIGIAVLFTTMCFAAQDVVANDPKTDAKPAGTVDCRMDFTFESWSVLYKTGDGAGTISCDNGQTAKVSLSAQGGGLTVGKSTIVNGVGKFSKVTSINELYGNYASGEAHAGVGGSASAQALMKDNVSLTLTGTGSGVDLGISFGNFKISKM